jgi:uncharacterized protein YdaU (DUF1376 family)
MAEFPALPLFTDAYMADTRHLNAAQHGAFLLLLMTAWRMPDCSLPDDDEKLSRWAAMDIRTWKNNKAVVMEFWQLSATQKWSQRRLLDERKRVEDKRDKNVIAGKASALKRHNTRSTPVQPKGNQNPTIPNPNPIKDKPPLPPEGGGRGLPVGKFGKEDWPGIERLMDDATFQSARTAAPGWDIYYLGRTYDESIRGGERDPPKVPKKAFPAWCAAYTKGKPP